MRGNGLGFPAAHLTCSGAARLPPDSLGSSAVSGKVLTKVFQILAQKGNQDHCDDRGKRKDRVSRREWQTEKAASQTEYQESDWL